MSAPRPVAGTPLPDAPPAWVLLLVFALALGLRLWWAPLFTFEGSDCDGAGYWNVARHIADGQGWLSNSYRFLYLPPPVLPQPDVHWSPLYPLLMAGAFKLAGVSMASARLPMLLCGAGLAVALALCTARLTRSAAAGTLAGLLAAVHPTLVTWSLRLETEVGTMLLVTLTLWALARLSTRRDALLAGALLGLAWLMKYQSGLLLVATVAGLLLRRDEYELPRAAGDLAPGAAAANRYRGGAPGDPGTLRPLSPGPAFLWILVAFCVVISPWLIRNLRHFGNPFFSAVAPMVLSGYREFGSEREFITRTTAPPATLAFLLQHLPEVVGRSLFGVRYLLTGLLREHLGSPWLAPLLLVGLVSALRQVWRRWLPALLWAAALTAACAVSIHQVRYLMSVIPLLVALAAAALSLRGPRWTRPLLGLLALVALLDMARQSNAAVHARGPGWTPGAMSCALEAETAGAWLAAHTRPGEALFATEVYHYALLTGRNAVNIPPVDADLRRLRARYAIRYLAIAERDIPTRLPTWQAAPPPWATLDTTLAPPPGHGTSPIRIYRVGE